MRQQYDIVKQIVLVGSILMTIPCFAVNNASQGVYFKANVINTITIAPPSISGSIHLGNIHPGDSLSPIPVSFSVSQNKRNATVSITASPASNTIVLSDGGVPAETFNINLTNFTSSTGSIAVGNDFVSGITISNLEPGTTTFSFDLTPEINVDQAEGNYTGSKDITFSVL